MGAVEQAVLHMIYSLAREEFQWEKNGNIDFDVSRLSEEVGAVHGAVLELSPIKTSRKKKLFFEARMSDGLKVCRMVSFEPKMHKVMKSLKEIGQAMSLANCIIKRSKYGEEEFEVAASKQSVVQPSTIYR